MTYLYFIGGLALLVLGAELLVRGASRIAAALGISPLVVGLTVVAFGTSAPEMAVSVKAAISGQTDIAVGNVVGSNIFNVLFILGLSALVTPLIVAQQLIRIDVPVMLAVSGLLVMLAWDGDISRVEAVVFLAGLLAYTAFQVIQARRERNAQVIAEYNQEYGEKKSNGAGVLGLQTIWIIIGLALLVIGAQWLVDSAVTFAKWFGVSEAVIGLTVVAAGTSLPEVAASLVAAFKGERDIAVGNVVGSNIFNILGVLGASALIAEGGLPVSPAINAFDMWVMLAVAVACLPIFFTGRSIARWEGVVFLAYYVAYTAYLIMDTTGHDALPQFSQWMMWFVLPITVLTIGIVLVRSLRAQTHSR